MKRLRSSLLSLTLLLCCFTFARAESGIPDAPVDSLSRGPYRFHQTMMKAEQAAADVHVQPLSHSVLAPLLRSSLPQVAREISVLAVGDIMPGTNYPRESYLPPDCRALFGPVKAADPFGRYCHGKPRRGLFFLRRHTEKLQGHHKLLCFQDARRIHQRNP